MTAMGRLVRGCIASLSILLACVAGGRVAAQGAGQGKQIFAEKAEPPCALCHTLKAADSTGTIGPNLDELKPDLEKIRKAVKDGVGNMPPYGDTLSEPEIEAVTAYVAGAVGTAK
jgi:mono/diheme cytochrome c family protein